MLKLTFTLAAALYAGFVIWGQPTDVALEREIATPVIASVVPTEAADFERPTILGATPEAQVTRTVVEAPDPAAVAASAPAPTSLQPRLIGEPMVVSLVAPANASTVADPVETSEDLMRVTGSRVNMRSGPSTADAVVDSLPRGTLAEALGDPIDGWQEIRDVESGLTGFMASRFLEPS